MDLVNLNSFLKFGYFLDYKNPNITFDFSGIDKEKYKNVTEDELVDIGIKLWKEAIQKQFNPNEKHVVPLSGGLDSRAILATLLEFTKAENIYTYTFGTPKTLDFDIGNLLAKKVGTNHTKYPLTEYKYDVEELIDISKRIDHQTLLFLHPPVSEIDRLFSDFNVWSGTIIDVFFGRHTHIQKANSWENAINNSFKENEFVTSIDLTNVEDEQYFKFINYDDDLKDTLVLEHVIDLLNRQLKFIAPHVLMKGYKYKLLLDKSLTRFALSIDNSLLENQYLYKKMFLRGFPKLFSLPTKSNFGLPLNTGRVKVLGKRLVNKMKRISNKFINIFPNPGINYIDFNEGIRNREDIKKIVYRNIMDLKQRKIVDWIDIDEIWKRHINKTADHADALLTLASLEIHLKAGKKI